MQNISITKEFTWDMAHMLAGHEGLCLNVHGHTYKLQVEVSRKEGSLIYHNENSLSMIVDFKDLKEIVNHKIIAPLDHAFMYWLDSPDPVEIEIADLLIKNKRKVVGVKFRPTAEEMALRFFKDLDQLLDTNGLELLSIKVWETPTSFAKVERKN